MNHLVQNIVTTGRPIEFDPAKALDAIMHLFWEKGFLGVTLPDLEKRTGLNRSSLYNSFGSKQEVFEQALDRYREMMGQQMCGPLERGERGLADIVSFLESVGEQFTKAKGTTGCLMVNSMVEFGGGDEIVARHSSKHLQRVRKAFTAALQRAADAGEIKSEGLASKAELLMSLLLGITVAARSGMSRNEVKALVDAARTQVDAWAGTAPHK